VTTDKHPNCEGCPYAAIGQGFVPGHGPVDAKLAFIGEAPAAEELGSGKPFQGPAGRELSSLCGSVGYDRTQAFTTNAIRCRPPDPDHSERGPQSAGKEAKRASELAAWARECWERHGRAELQGLTQVNVVGALGAVALRMLLGHQSIRKHRGSVYPYVIDGRARKVIGTLHPASTMRWDRERKMRFAARADIRRMVRQAETPELPETGERFTIAPTFEDAVMFLDRILSRKLEVTYDIETTGLNIADADVICIGFDDGSQSLCVPIWNDDETEYWPRDQFLEIVARIAAIFADPAIAKVTQNGTFDESVLLLRGFEFAGPRLDTCYLHHTILSEAPHRLAFLASLYTYLPFYKDDVKGDFGGSTAEGDSDAVFRTYNLRDCLATRVTKRSLEAQAVRSGLDKFYTRVVMPLQAAASDMQASGIPVDIERRDEISESLNNRLVELEGRLRGRLGEKCPGNLRSKDEWAVLLYDVMGYPVRKRTPRLGRPSVDIDELKRIYRTTTSEEDKDTLRLLLDFNKTDKMRGTFIDNVVPNSDGRVRPSWSMHGTPTGRYGCKNPDMQNVPQGICREIYVAGEDHILSYLDYRSFEMWIIALLFDDDALLETLEAGRSPHLQNVVDLVGGVTYEEAKRLHSIEDPTFERTYVTIKNYGFGSHYGASPNTIYENMCARMDDPPDLGTVISYQEADIARHPQIARGKQAILDEVRETRQLTGIHGRPRTFLGPGAEIMTEALNYKMQNGAADTMNLAQGLIFQALGRGRIISQNHDAFLGRHHKDVWEAEVRKMKEIMERPITFRNQWGHTVTHSFSVDVKVGPNWGRMQEVPQWT